jgi:hypothetical protein
MEENMLIKLTSKGMSEVKGGFVEKDCYEGCKTLCKAFCNGTPYLFSTQFSEEADVSASLNNPH